MLHAPSLSPNLNFDIPATAGALALAVPPVATETTCAAVYERLAGTPDPGVVVIDSEHRPVGLVSRHTMLARYAERYGPELYGRRPIAFMMDKDPLIVDEGTSINELGRQVAVERPA